MMERIGTLHKGYDVAGFVRLPKARELAAITKFSILAWIMAITLSADLKCQTTIPQTPEAAAQAMIDVTNNRDWDGMAALMHPDAIEEMAGLFSPIFNHPYGAETRNLILGVSSAEEYEELGDRGVFARIMRFSMAQDPTMIEILSNASIEILGTVPEGETKAHVLFRMSMSLDDFEFSMMDVASFQRYESGWLGILKGDIGAIAAALRSALPEVED